MSDVTDRQEVWLVRGNTDETEARIWTCNETNNIWIPIEQDEPTEYVRADRIEKLEAKLQNQTHLIEQLFALLDKTEETDDGIVFHPNQLRSCRASDTEKLSKILAKLKGQEE